LSNGNLTSLMISSTIRRKLRNMTIPSSLLIRSLGLNPRLQPSLAQIRGLQKEKAAPMRERRLIRNSIRKLRPISTKLRSQGLEVSRMTAYIAKNLMLNP